MSIQTLVQRAGYNWDRIPNWFQGDLADDYSPGDECEPLLVDRVARLLEDEVPEAKLPGGRRSRWHPE